MLLIFSLLSFESCFLYILDMFLIMYMQSIYLLIFVFPIYLLY